MAGSVRDEIWVWKGITGRRNNLGSLRWQYFGLFGKKGIRKHSIGWKRIWIRLERDDFRP